MPLLPTADLGGSLAEEQLPAEEVPAARCLQLRTWPCARQPARPPPKPRRVARLDALPLRTLPWPGLLKF